MPVPRRSIESRTLPHVGSEPGAGKLQSALRATMRPLLPRLWDLNVEGFEQIPADGPALLCPNHISFFDSPLLTFLVHRNISFVGKAEYMDSWKTKYVFPAMGMIPIDRSGGSASAAALDLAEGVLRRGELFGMYPEGTRSRDGNLHKGRTGAARLAMSVDCPIFPVGIIGTDEIQPPDAPAPKLRKSATVREGRPVLPSRYRGRGAEHIAWRSMIDEVMVEISELTGRRYVDTYAGSKAEAEPTVEAKVATVEARRPGVPAEPGLAVVGGD